MNRDDLLKDLQPRCELCACFKAVDAAQGVCRLHPAAVQFILVPVRGLQGDGMQLMPACGQPTMPKDGWCWEFKDTKTVLSH